MALSKVNFNSLNVTPSASKFLAWDGDADALAAADIGGALTLIATATASSSATIDFTSGIDSTYKEYIFMFNNIHPASQAFLGFNFSIDGGSNYNAVKTSTNFRAYHSEAGASNLEYKDGDDIAQGTGLVLTAGNLGNANDEASSGYLHLFEPSSDTFVKHFIFRSSSVSSTPASFDCYVAGYVNTTSAVNGVEFKMSSGNIDAGTIQMFGVVK